MPQTFEIDTISDIISWEVINLITKEMVDRINVLARKQKDGSLTPEEKEEQHNLRQQYVKAIKAQVVDALETAGYTPKSQHGDGCGCGCKPKEKSTGECGCGCQSLPKTLH